LFFLLRASLWIGAIILLVPMLPQMHSTEPPAGAAPPANPVAIASSALRAVTTAAPASAPAAPAAAPVAAAPVPAPSLPAAADIVGFCLENGDVCEAGFSVVAALGDAVGQGLELAATLQHGGAATPAPAAAVPAYDQPIAVATVPVRVTALPAAAGGTLTAADRAEPWLGDAASAAATAATSAATAIGLSVPLPVPDPRRRPSG
jgi:hypothetical protein